MINQLSEETIDQIAAGEVVERPASIVKELCENSIDAGADAISVEIRDGGTTLIRVSDNGCGIAADELPKAFMRHATSKISCIEDLQFLGTLGFRGEALSSISAVSQVEVITKTSDKLIGSRLTIDGGNMGEIQEVGAPNGTTFIVRNIFYNTPVRRKFLKSNTTEGAYVAEVMEHLALSHPDISFSFINNGKASLQTIRGGMLKDVIYKIYGRDIARDVVPIESASLNGFIGKPLLSRGNRSFEVFFVNGRYVKSTLLSKAVEEAFKPYLMQHRFPVAILNIALEGSMVDANVHPTKLEVRFSDNEAVFELIKNEISNTLSRIELIPNVSVPKPVIMDSLVTAITSEGNTNIDNAESIVAASNSSAVVNCADTSNSAAVVNTADAVNKADIAGKTVALDHKVQDKRPALPFEESRLIKEAATYKEEIGEIEAIEQDLFETKILTKEARNEYKIIGQAFDTYWIIEYDKKLLFIDQHAAHEKVLYEKFLTQIKNSQVFSQQLMPPTIVSLSSREQDVLNRYMEVFASVGFEIEEFGGNEYALRGVPEQFSNIDPRLIFSEILDGLESSEGRNVSSDLVLDRIATMACKAAVKGNNRISRAEIESLLNDLLSLDNPYNCPHGRPTMITMTEYEMEKKFKRIV